MELTDSAPTSAPAVESAPAPEAPSSEPTTSPDVTAPSSEVEESPQAPDATEANAPADPAPLGEETPATSGDEPDAAEPPPPSGEGDEDAPALSHSDAADPDGPQGDALAPDAYRDWFDALPPEEQAEALGIPEEFRRPGYFYYDEREGHGKHKTHADYLRHRAANDQFATGFRKEKEALVSERDDYRSKWEESERVRAILDAQLAEYYGGSPDEADPMSVVVQKHLPDDLKGKSLDDFDYGPERDQFVVALDRARTAAKTEAEAAAKRAEAEHEAQLAAIERGATFFEEEVTPEAFGVQGNYDLEAAMGSVLTDRVGDSEATWADAVRETAGVNPALGKMLVRALKVETYLRAGEPLPYGEVDPKPKATPKAPAARPDQQQQSETSGGQPAAPTKSAETAGGSPDSARKPSDAPVAPRTVPVTETSIQTSPALSAPPSGRPKPEYIKDRARDMIGGAIEETARRRR